MIACFNIISTKNCKDLMHFKYSEKKYFRFNFVRPRYKYSSSECGLKHTCRSCEAVIKEYTALSLELFSLTATLSRQARPLIFFFQAVRGYL